MRIDELKTHALRLSDVQRAELAAELLSSLDDAETADVEQLWLDEAERRYRACKRDPRRALTAKRAFDEANSGLR